MARQRAAAPEVLNGKRPSDARPKAMKKASEYRQHAEECRVLARGMAPSGQRDQLLDMARTWDNLADERAQLISRYPELALEGEQAEESSRS